MTIAASSGNIHVIKLIEALGLGDLHHIKELHLHIVTDDVVTVDVIRYVTDEELEKLVKVAETYKLTTKKLEEEKEEKADV